MSLRIKGQECVIRIISNGAVVNELTAIQSGDLSIDMELIDKGYLGEKTNRKDDVFNGVSGSFSLHVSDKGVFDFLTNIKKRAQRKTALFSVDIIWVWNFPNGDQAKILLADCYFGQVPFSFSDRGEYVDMTLSFQASDYKVL